MTEKKRFIVDDAGTLIDMETRNTYDYVSDVVGLLNSLNDENKQLRKENKELHFIIQQNNFAKQEGFE